MRVQAEGEREPGPGVRLRRACWGRGPLWPGPEVDVGVAGGWGERLDFMAAFGQKREKIP